MMPATCHPDRKHKGNGLCNPCWQRKWRAEHPGQTWQERNPDVAKAYGQAWYQANRVKIADRRRAYRAENRYVARDRRIYLRYTYDLSPDDFRDMLVGQAGRCLICDHVMQPGRDTHIDHDHRTGKVRGLLCERCNKGIGHFKDEPSRLRAAARYLETAA